MKVSTSYQSNLCTPYRIIIKDADISLGYLEKPMPLTTSSQTKLTIPDQSYVIVIKLSMPIVI
jgi:hypothetical protein